MKNLPFKPVPCGLLLGLPLQAEAMFTDGAVPPRYGWLAFAVFAAIIAFTMGVTWIAARRVRDAQQFYAAGRSITGL